MVGSGVLGGVGWVGGWFMGVGEWESGWVGCLGRGGTIG